MAGGGFMRAATKQHYERKPRGFFENYKKQYGGDTTPMPENNTGGSKPMDRRKELLKDISISRWATIFVLLFIVLTGLYVIFFV